MALAVVLHMFHSIFIPRIMRVILSEFFNQLLFKNDYDILHKHLIVTY